MRQGLQSGRFQQAGYEPLLSDLTLSEMLQIERLTSLAPDNQQASVQ